MRLAIVHYHLRRGGVTKVIASALNALGDSVEAVVLSSTEAGEPLPCEVAVIPELAYCREGSQEAAGRLASKMKEAVRNAFGEDPDVWHIHNHSLGKNVNFPEALKGLLQDGQRVLLQIHDFAEDGRPGNYKDQLKPFTEKQFKDYDATLWPIGPHIHYAVLNGRDREILSKAGIADDQLHWLPNAVTAPMASTEPPIETSSSGKPPLILYPTRAIRRKNVGEVLLMAAAYPEYRYATTLSPDNPQWKPIHDGWIRLGAQLKLPVEFAMGERPENTYEGLIKEASSMMTTSVGEGFGLAFLEPWLMGKPVIGRDLPDITEDFKDNGIRLPNLYQQWNISLEGFNNSALHERFGIVAEAVYSAYGRDIERKQVDAAWDSLTHNNQIDFGVLDERAQAEVLEYYHDNHNTLREAAPLNPNDIDSGVLEKNTEIIKGTYGMDAYRNSLMNIYHGLAQAPLKTPESVSGQSILDAFLDLGKIRFLRT